ncbi:MAG: hypothetical protein AB2L14_36455 [Candidatus Xenobiia bacterium LiM19]
MVSYSVYYLKDRTLEDMERLAGSEKDIGFDFGRINAFPDSPWLECSFNGDDYPPDDAALSGELSVIQKLSERLGEVIFLFCSKPDSFYFEHARDGVLLRKLVWMPMLDDFGTPGWICAQGESEPWEREFFFSEKKRSLAIQKERDLLSMEPDFDTIFPAREAEIRRIWENREITGGNAFPACDWTVAIPVEKIYGLQHKDDPWK